MVACCVNPTEGGEVPMRFLVGVCVGVAATLAWQSYGDAARAMVAGTLPQLGWLAPQAAVAPQPAAVAPQPAAVAPQPAAVAPQPAATPARKPGQPPLQVTPSR